MSYNKVSVNDFSFWFVSYDWDRYTQSWNLKLFICAKQKYKTIFFFTLADYVWRVVLKAESKDQRAQNSFQYTLTENDKNRFLKALVGESNPRCLKHFLLRSKNPAAANLKLCYAEFIPDERLKLSLETQTRNITLLQQYDVETCVYQCLKENNCCDLLLCTEKGYGKLWY